MNTDRADAVTLALHAAKKPRAAQRVWARFWRLEPGDTFFDPLAKDGLEWMIIVKKTSPFTYVRGSGKVKFIAPWRRVRTTKFRYLTPMERQLSKAICRPTSYMKLMESSPWPTRMGETGAIEQTGPSA